jgi:hypothetical protein
MDDDRLLATSVHECGHGVMALLVGLTPLYVTNVADETSGGRMYWAQGKRPPFRIVEHLVTSDDHALALVYVAGVAAVRVVLDTPADLASVDDERARSYGRTTSIGEEAAVRKLLADAEEIFGNEHVRNVTLSLAYRLARERVVPGRDIEALIEAVGLRRGEETILSAASGRERRTLATRGQSAGVLGDPSFAERSSSTYFFAGREHTSRA